jgi:hypothetical protein
MGPAGPGGRAGQVRVEPTSSAQVEKDRFSFFRILFLIPETIPEIAEIVLMARKILRKSQKIQENS